MAILRNNPPITFDVTSSEHRRMYNNFRVNNTWKGAPRFVLEAQFVSVPAMIESKMLAYYMEREFGVNQNG
jgi:hypothetical protein